jgi:hypothetical protein
MIGSEAERRFGFANDLLAPAQLLGLSGARQMLLYGHGHRRSDGGRSRVRSSRALRLGRGLTTSRQWADEHRR